MQNANEYLEDVEKYHWLSSSEDSRLVREFVYGTDGKYVFKTRNKKKCDAKIMRSRVYLAILHLSFNSKMSCSRIGNIIGYSHQRTQRMWHAAMEKLREMYKIHHEEY